jgi:hypothetical protein
MSCQAIQAEVIRVTYEWDDLGWVLCEVLSELVIVDY